MVEASKQFGALINGIIRQQFYNDSELTDDILKDEIFPDMANGEFNSLHNKYKGILKSMASTSMDLTQAETFLTSQSKKKDSGISESHVKVLLKAWKNHKDKIHDNLINKCSWENQLKNISWRIDVKTRTKELEQINAPTAIVELLLGSRQNKNCQDEVVQFEMDEQGLSVLMKNVHEIEEQLKKHASTHN